MPNLLLVLVFVVVIAGVLPIIGLFVWHARRLLASAFIDTRARRTHARGRLQMLLLLYGSVAALLFVSGVLAATKDEPFGVVAGLTMIAMGLAYAWALYAAFARSRRSTLTK